MPTAQHAPYSRLLLIDYQPSASDSHPGVNGFEHGRPRNWLYAYQSPFTSDDRTPIQPRTRRNNCELKPRFFITTLNYPDATLMAPSLVFPPGPRHA